MADRDARSHHRMASGVLHLSANPEGVQRIAFGMADRPSPLLRLPSYRFGRELTLDHRLLLRTGTGASPLHISLAFERAVANCTPLVPFVPFVPLNGLSPVVPRSWLNFHLTSRLWAAGRPSSLLRLTFYRCLIAFHIHAGEAEPRDGCEA